MTSSRKKVVTVDDDSSIRMLIKSALRGLKAVEVFEAGDGLEGLQTIRREQPDLVLLDVVMPHQDGIETYYQLRQDPAYSSTPIIMLTAVKDNEKLLPLLQHDHTEFLAKPFVIEVLREKVRALLNLDA